MFSVSTNIYKCDSLSASSNKDEVLKAIKRIEEVSCVKFVPKVDQVDFVSIDSMEEA